MSQPNDGRPAALISHIFHHVRDNGKLIKEAKTSFGADVWQLGSVWVSLEDDGYTQRVEAEGFGVDARSSGGRVSLGETRVQNLQKLHESIFNQSE